MSKSILFTLLLFLQGISWGACYTWKAPEELTQGYEDRLEWELRSFDLIKWNEHPCKHQLRVELKPMLSKWYVQYQFDSLPELRNKYETLDDFSKGLPKDLKKLMGTYQSEDFKSMKAKYSRNRLKMLKPDYWPLFEVGLMSETRAFGDKSQTLTGLELALTRNISEWHYEIHMGFAYQGHNPNADDVWLDWKSHLGLDLEYAIFDENLHTPTLNTGFDLQGFWVRTPKRWKGGGLDLVPEWTLGAGFRGFRAHAFNLGLDTKLHLPLGNIQVLHVDEDALKEYYPIGFSLQLQAGF